jgi:hypothetical protein
MCADQLPYRAARQQAPASPRPGACRAMIDLVAALVESGPDGNGAEKAA